MAKVTITVCDRCSEAIDENKPNMVIVRLFSQKASEGLKMELCDDCTNHILKELK